MRRIRWTRRSLWHLDKIAAYLKDRNPQAADRVTKRIRLRVSQLAEHPYIGRKGRLQGTRELFVGRYQYKVVYRLTADIVLPAFPSPRWRLWPGEHVARFESGKGAFLRRR